MKKYILSFLVVIVLGIGASFYYGLLWFVYPDRERFPIMGIDVSHYQGSIDWKSVKNDEVSFVYLKATEGDDWVDKKFLENYSGVRSVGIPVGVYHFYSLRISAKDQLENIFRTLSGVILNLPIVIDLEFGGNTSFRPSVESFQKDLQVFLDEVEKYQGTKPILYTTYEFSEQYLGNNFQRYHLWIRDVISPPNMDNWLIWQYKNRGHISGINGFVDQNVLSGALKNMLLK